MEIRELGREQIDGRVFVRLQIDGREALIGLAQKAIDAGLIYLGADFEEDYSAVLPADPENGRPEDQIMAGFVDDKRVVALVRRVRDEVFGREL